MDEAWLDRFRSWVYGIGFGWQIGTGISTYIMTAGVYLTVALAALTGRPAVAMGICVLFGLVRGLAILTGAGLTDPARLRTFHQRFEAAGPPVRTAVAGVLGAVGVAAGAGAAGAVGAAVALAAVVGVVALAAGPARRRVAQPVFGAEPLLGTSR